MEEAREPTITENVDIDIFWFASKTNVITASSTPIDVLRFQNWMKTLTFFGVRYYIRILWSIVETQLQKD